MRLITQILCIILLSISIFAGTYTVDIDALKKKISLNGFTNESFSEYLFYLENNNAENEEKFISLLNEGFKKDFLLGVLKYKSQKFDEAFNLLFTRLKEKPASQKYYEYLVKSAGITGNYDQLENYVKDKDDYRFIYLSGLVDYYETDYEKAKGKFLKALEAETNSAEIIIYLANTYRRLGDYQKATEILDKKINTLFPEDPYYAEILVAKGSLLFLTGEYDKAALIYNEGIAAAEESANKAEEIKANLNLGMISDLYGDVVNARDYFEYAYRSAKEINQLELEATVLGEWAVSHTYTNQLIEARQKYLEAYHIFLKLNHKERLALTANNIANLFLSIGNYKSALNYYNLSLNHAGENIRTKMLSFRGLGDVYNNLANYGEALRYYKKAKDLAIQIDDTGAETEINIGRGILFYNLGEPEKSLNILLENYDEINQNDYPYLKAELNQKIGIVNTTLTNLAGAKKYLEKSVELSDKFGDIYNSILSNTYLAYAYLLSDEIITGREVLNRQLKLSEEYNLYQLAGIQSLLLSEIFNGNNKLNYLFKAEEYASNASDKNTLTEIYYKLGQFYEKDDKPAKAEKYYLEAISIIENQLPVLANKNEIQIQYFSNYYDIYTSLIDLYLGMNRVDDAFYFLDKSRSRNNLYNLTAIKLSKTNDDKLLNEYYDLNWNLYYGLTAANEIDSLKIELNKLKNELVEKYPHISNLLSLDQNGIKRSNFKKLENNKYFISYYFKSDSLYAFLLNENNIQLINLGSDRNEIQSSISSTSPYFNEKINKGNVRINKDLFSFNSSAAYSLYKEVLEPVLNEIPKDSELIFSLPNELVTIPFEFITTNENSLNDPYYWSDKRFLIEDYTISYAPSFSVWNELESRAQSENNTALLMGDPSFGDESGEYAVNRGEPEDLDLYLRSIKFLPLKYSSEEIESIDKYFHNDIVLLDDDATETNFKLNSNNVSIIHLSTHSFLFKDNPVVIFSPNDNKNDGYLETGEVVGMNLDSDLIVLSSCKSGLGKTDAAEGVLGMQKVFFDAGTSAIILSLWDVSDKQTSILMNSFYQYLSEGLSKPEALRQAKIKFIKEVDSNPYHWAAFTLAGNTAGVSFVKESNNYLYLFAFLLFVPAVYFLLRKRRVIMPISMKND